MQARIPSTLESLSALAILLLALFAVPGTAHAQSSGPGAYQTADLADFVTSVPTGGAATLYRTENSLDLRVSGADLDAGAVYTIWWILWNNPKLCSDSCGLDDLGIQGNTILYATGFVTDMDGTANATATLVAGKVPSGVEELIPGGLFPGRGLAAEAHLIVRSHGPVLTGSVAEQISSFGGGCNPECEDQQFTIFVAAD